MIPILAAIASGLLLAKTTTKKEKNNGLKGAQHKGAAKTALDDCGRLKKGYKFNKGGKIVKITKRKKKSEKQTIKAKILALKSKLGAPKQPVNDFSICNLTGALLNGGITVLTDDEQNLFSDHENNLGLNASSKDVNQIVNEMVLDKLKTGEKLPPWRQTWANRTPIPAQNFVTKKPYSGTNSILLNVILGATAKTPYYLTLKQIEKLKGKLQKGSKAVYLVYYNFSFVLKDLSSNSELEKKLLKKINGYEIKRKTKSKNKVLNKSNYDNTYLTQNEVDYLKLERNEYYSKGTLRYYKVFNIADTTGIEYTLPPPIKRNDNEKLKIAENIISSISSKPKIKNGSQPLYNSSTDTIEIPDITDFDNSEEYYATLFHELIHSTKVKERLNRDKDYEDKEIEAAYAFEELIAELGASYLLGICGILENTHTNNASYLQGWHKKLVELAENDSNFFVYATKEAQKAVDYILKDYVEYTENSSETKTKNNNTKSELIRARARAKATAIKLKLKLKK